jgi:RNA polymerase primary sigma factor
MRLRQLKITNSVTNRDSISLNKYLQEIGKLKTISPDEEVTLCERMRNGDNHAFDLLVRANLRFVVSVAKQYQGQGLELADLVNEGNIGMIYAAKKFDETRGFRFISYAVWWIRQEIVRAISQQSQAIREPMNKILLRSRVRKATNQMEQQLDRQPTTEELSEALHIPVEDIGEIQVRNTKVLSLDAPLSDEEDGGSLADTIINPNAEDTDSNLSKGESLGTEIKRHLGLLSDRQKDTICYFFGIGGSEPMSLEEISRKFELTPERVRQIKDKALQKLRTTGNTRVLMSFL